MLSKATQQHNSLSEKKSIQLGLQLPKKIFTGIFCILLCLHIQGTVILQGNMTQQFEVFTTWLIYFWMEQEDKPIYHQMIPFLSSCTHLQMLFLMSGWEGILQVRCAHGQRWDGWLSVSVVTGAHLLLVGQKDAPKFRRERTGIWTVSIVNKDRVITSKLSSSPHWHPFLNHCLWRYLARDTRNNWRKQSVQTHCLHWAKTV